MEPEQKRSKTGAEDDESAKRSEPSAASSSAPAASSVASAPAPALSTRGTTSSSTSTTTSTASTTTKEHQQRPRRRRSYCAVVEMYDPGVFREQFPPEEWESVSVDDAVRRRFVDFVFLDGWKMYDKRFWRIQSHIKSRITAPIITNKVDLHQLLSREAPELIPETHVVPQSGRAPAIDVDRAHPWIFRADALEGGGVGVSVLLSQEEYVREQRELGRNRWKNALVSRYITEPLLVEDSGEMYKFHLRIYLIVTVDSRDRRRNRAGIFRKAEIALASAPYQRENVQDKQSHDTHLKKGVLDFATRYPGGAEAAASMFEKVRAMLQRVCELTVKTVEGYEESDIGYQVLGCDVMVDTDQRPWLIEINSSPGLSEIYPGRTAEVSRILLEGVKEFVFEGKAGDQLQRIVELVA